jgi:hypothetical protein
MLADQIFTGCGKTRRSGAKGEGFRRESRVNFEKFFDTIAHEPLIEATPHSPKGDVSYVGALELTACSVPTASGLAVLSHC